MQTSSNTANKPTLQLADIQQPVLHDLEAVNQLISTSLTAKLPLVNHMTDYIIKSGGKRLRPLLVLLSAKACGYQEDTEHHDLAIVIEFIHTATLLHDDVIDHANKRRGKKAAHLLWGNQASILVGDFLYSRAFQILAERNNLPVMNLLAQTTNQIAEGELWQLNYQNNPEIDESTYYQIIQRKTAELFKATTAVGAMIGSHKQPDHLICAMKNFGLYFGLAYQMVDDLLDYIPGPDILKKKIGNDLAEGKMTLPLIYAKQFTSQTNIKKIDHIIKNTDQYDFTDSLFNEITDILKETGALDYTLKQAKEQMHLAQQELAGLTPSPFLDSLYALVDFVIGRPIASVQNGV